MKYSFQYVLANRKGPNQTREKFIADNYVIMSRISKSVSSVPAWVFLNLGVRPDTVTIISILFIILSAAFFVVGAPLLAVLAYLVFAIFDSTDGDMARIVGPTKYGGVMDSFGADFFYALIPASMGYYLFREEVSTTIVGHEQILLIGFLVSATFLLYRMINTKTVSFQRSLGGSARLPGEESFVGAKESSLKVIIWKIVKWYRNDVFRNNFFAEPGLILWPAVFIIIGKFDYLVFYLTLLLAYNIGYLITTFIKTYRIFRVHG